MFAAPVSRVGPGAGREMIDDGVGSPVLRMEVSSTSLRRVPHEYADVKPAAPAHDWGHEARKLGRHCQRSHIASCKRFAAFLGRAPDTASADNVRRFQLHRLDGGAAGRVAARAVFPRVFTRPAAIADIAFQMWVSTPTRPGQTQYRHHQTSDTVRHPCRV